MASISKERDTGRLIIQFVSPFDGRRRSMRLGTASREIADRVKSLVERLVVAARFGLRDQEAERWAADLPFKNAKPLMDAGLLKVRRKSSAKQNWQSQIKSLQEWASLKLDGESA